jgi:hypothetical protein
VRWRRHPQDAPPSRAITSRGISGGTQAPEHRPRAGAPTTIAVVAAHAARGTCRSEPALSAGPLRRNAAPATAVHRAARRGDNTRSGRGSRIDAPGPAINDERGEGVGEEGRGWRRRSRAGPPPLQPAPPVASRHRALVPALPAAPFQSDRGSASTAAPPPASTPPAASRSAAAPSPPRAVTPPWMAVTLASGQVQRQGAGSSHGGAKSGGGTAGSEASRRAVAVARPSRAASSSSR